jgi:uncharacterized membrane protein YfcA
VDYLIVCTTAFFAAGLTLFSGFGLGTLLLPVLALFFPVEVAVAATAAVHLLNNLFKLTLVGKHADRGVLLKFGVPAALAAVVGAWILTLLADLPAIYEYTLGPGTARITPVKLVVSALIFVFALADLFPRAERVGFDRKWLPAGGLLSGLFGGLSGHQGAFRTAFLIKAGLSKEAFIGTGATCAVLVDASRLLVYGSSFFTGHFALIAAEGGYALLAAAALAAFAGSFVGARLVKKVTLVTIQRTVGALLMLFSIAMGSGVL